MICFDGSNHSGRSIVFVIIVILVGLRFLLRLPSPLTLIVHLTLALVVLGSDLLTSWTTILINSPVRATRWTPIVSNSGYLLLMSFYPNYLLFGIHRIMRPVFPVGPGTTIMLHPIDLGQLMVLERVVPDLSVPSSLL